MAFERAGGMAAQGRERSLEREVEFLQKVERRLLDVRHVLRNADRKAGERAHFHHVALIQEYLPSGVSHWNFVGVPSEPFANSYFCSVMPSQGCRPFV